MSEQSADILAASFADAGGVPCSREDLEARVKNYMELVVARTYDRYTGENLEAEGRVTIHKVRVSKNFPSDFGLTLESYWGHETGPVRKAYEDDIALAIADWIGVDFGLVGVTVHIVTYEA
jgi:hypothetical protein